ncbi:MAG: MBL fold metallo-hydrolase [Myxococcales bacterium]|nr:MBL fold metallo-hydrolase [Myxococcales bacterium]
MRSRLAHPRLVAGAAAALLLASQAGCPDTEVPSLAGPDGTTRTCTADELEAFRAASDADERTDLWVAFVDVGQGDATWIRTPGIVDVNAKDILVDAGDSGEAPRTFAPDGDEALVDFMESSGWGPGRRVDYLVVTHTDIDHYGGAERILEDYQVETYIDPGRDAPDQSTYQRLLGAVAAEPGITVLRPAAETGIDPAVPGATTSQGWGRDVTVRLVSANQFASSDNDSSVVLMVEYRGVRLLLTGDTEFSLEEKLLREGANLSANVLKAGHHGARETNSAAFLDAVFPNDDGYRYAVISSGQRDNLPFADTVERLLDAVGMDGLYRTDRDDAGKSQREAPGDDHILMRVTEDGELTLCYAFPD